MAFLTVHRLFTVLCSLKQRAARTEYGGERDSSFSFYKTAESRKLEQDKEQPGFTKPIGPTLTSDYVEEKNYLH